MPWLIVVLGYLLGSIPTAYIAGRLLKGKDIRQMGDGNVGARNAFHQLGHKTGIGIFIFDIAKGALPVLIARAAALPQIAILITGVATVVGHNWPIYIGFRGGRGVATTIGVLLIILTQPILIMAAPALAALVIKKNALFASAFLFVALPLVGWWLGLTGVYIIYGIALSGLVGCTHFWRTRRVGASGAASS